MKKYIFLASITIFSQDQKSVEIHISNYSDQFYLRIQTNDDKVHILNPVNINIADTIKLPLIFNRDNDFYKTSLIVGYYNFEDVYNYKVRPFCIEKVVFHLTPAQMDAIFDTAGILYLNITTNLLWKMATLGWGSCFAISSDNVKTFSSLNYPEHTHLERDKYIYQMKSN